jgi:hypothetical protein
MYLNALISEYVFISGTKADGWNAYEAVAISMVWCEKNRPDDCPAGMYRAQGVSVRRKVQAG